MARIQELTQIAADIWVPQQVVYDVCADHGKIGERFLSLHPSASMIWLDQIQHLCDGLASKFGAHRVVCADARTYGFTPGSLGILAGVGGELAAQILGNSGPEMIWVLCIGQRVQTMRKALIEYGIGLRIECLIQEGQQFYECLVCSKSFETPISECGGEGIWKGELGRFYYNQRLHYAKTLARHGDHDLHEKLALLGQKYELNGH